MPSFAVPIASAVRTVIAALTNAPSLVEVRKTDVAFPRDITTAFSAVIITIGNEREFMAVSSAGTSTDQGDVLKVYEIGISIYGKLFGKLASDLTNHPDFVLQCKQALNKTTLAGVPTVFRTQLIEHDEWERNEFGKDGEVSRFGLLFFNAETRLGN